MNEVHIPTAVDLSLSPIDREWLRDRLILFGLKREDVHRTVDFCAAYLDTCGIATRRGVEDFLRDEVVLAELRDVYRTVLRRQTHAEAYVGLGLGLSERATVHARIVEDEVLDPVGLCQWGALLRVRREIGGDNGMREASRGLRALLAQYPEAIAGLASVHQVTPAGLAIAPPQPEPVARAAAAELPAPTKSPRPARKSRSKARRR